MAEVRVWMGEMEQCTKVDIFIGNYRLVVLWLVWRRTNDRRLAPLRWIPNKSSNCWHKKTISQSYCRYVLCMSCISPSIQITYDFIHHAHLCAENLSYKSECRQILPRNPLQTHISIFLSCDSIHFLFLSYLIFFRSCVLCAVRTVKNEHETRNEI